jgi:hypothetical protein
MLITYLGPLRPLYLYPTTAASVIGQSESIYACPVSDQFLELFGR